MIAVIFGSLKGNRAIKLVMFQVALPNDTLPDSAHWRLQIIKESKKVTKNKNKWSYSNPLRRAT